MNTAPNSPTTSRLLVVLAMTALVLGGCAAIQKEVAEEEEPDTPVTCEWRDVRGVAELMEVFNGEGEFVFYPGEEVIRKPLEDHHSVGTEYTALLRVDQTGHCDAELELHSELP